MQALLNTIYIKYIYVYFIYIKSLTGIFNSSYSLFYITLYFPTFNISSIKLKRVQSYLVSVTFPQDTIKGKEKYCLLRMKTHKAHSFQVKYCKLHSSIFS